MSNTFRLITFNKNIRNSTSLAYDKKFFTDKNTGIENYPSVGDLLSIVRFKSDEHGQAIINPSTGKMIYEDTNTFRVNAPVKIDRRSEEQIRMNPIVPSQNFFGKAGKMTHRVVFPNVSLHINN